MLDFTGVLAAWPVFLEGLAITALLTVISCTLGTLLGIACAWCRVQGSRATRLAVACYVEFFRNTPFIVQIFFIYFGLPAIGLRFASFPAAIFALTINLGAYACEIIRAGIEATPKGQHEAAQSLGLGRWHIFTRVVLPPALSRVWPGLTSQLVIIMLATAVCSLISTAELSYVTNRIAAETFRQFESYIVVTLLYLALSIMFRRLLQWLGPRFLFGCAPVGVSR
ncbi:polar amino acid ABC transporter permease [Bordetella genomosp. 9]|uniref:Polar amino acid ABC transporter permease n=1 Tax=Bordetella genomosp. 9 TaxID=1416803 RepID=A0A261RFT8_9BORD|nr:amino acid ABC transporter permease [Bordetella genomosp. 9]OZI23908.1 polar amino acid ABC transporter permease [Bordetella genomosp. 9]